MKDIQGYEGLYAVTSCGKVWSYRSQRFLKLYDSGGYLKVGLYKDGKKEQFRVHRLVAQAYIPNPLGLPQVNHINEIKTENHVNNLEWVTSKDNINHGTRIERAKVNGLGRHPKKVYCVELDKYFPTITSAAKEFGIHKQGISDCLRGKQKTAGKCHWEYAE